MTTDVLLEIIEEAIELPLANGTPVHVIFFRRSSGGLGMTMATMPACWHVPISLISQNSGTLRRCLADARKVLDAKGG